MNLSLRGLVAAAVSPLATVSAVGQTRAEAKFLDELDSTFRYFDTRWDEANGWFYENILTIASRGASA